MPHTALRLFFFSFALFTSVIAHASPNRQLDRQGQVLIDGIQETDLGSLQLRLVGDRRGRLRGELSLIDREASTAITGVIRRGMLSLRGSFRGEAIRERVPLSYVIEIDRSEPTPRAKLPKLTCPGKIGKLICAVANTIITICIDDGEIFGIKCGDGGPSGTPDGGDTDGGGGDDGGASTSG